VQEDVGESAFGAYLPRTNAQALPPGSPMAAGRAANNEPSTPNDAAGGAQQQRQPDLGFLRRYHSPAAPAYGGGYAGTPGRRDTGRLLGNVRGRASTPRHMLPTVPIP
jgi:hypothetical protein